MFKFTLVISPILSLSQIDLDEVVGGQLYVYHEGKFKTTWNYNN